MIAVIAIWIGVGLLFVACNDPKAYPTLADRGLDVILWPLYGPVYVAGWIAKKLFG